MSVSAFPLADALRAKPDNGSSGPLSSNDCPSPPLAPQTRPDMVADDEKNDLSKDDSLLPQWNSTQLLAEPAGFVKDRMVTASCIALNTFATVAMVFLSKRTFSDPQMHDAQVLFTIWHFTCTAIVLWISTRAPFRAFKPVRLPLRGVLPICVMFTAYVILGNLSLTYNSIGFYQLAKVMTTPCVVLVTFVLFRTTVTIYRILAILCICAGVIMTNGGSAQSNPFGAIIAVMAVTVTAFYQIWIGKKIDDLDVTPQQLLMNQAPISAFLLLFIVPVMDKIPDFRKLNSSLFCIIAAC